jgi:putative lipoprotein
MRAVLVAIAAGTLIACGQRDEIPPPVQVDSTGAVEASSIAPSPAADSIATPLPQLTDQMWALVALGDGSPPPAGAQGRQATMRLDSGSPRVSGFAGCNRYSGSYLLSGDSLRLGAIASTKMACPDGEALERVVLGLLPRVTTYVLTHQGLELRGFGGTLGRFTPLVGKGGTATELAY